MDIHNDDDLFTCESGKAHLVFHWCLYNEEQHYAELLRLKRQGA